MKKAAPTTARISQRRSWAAVSFKAISLSVAWRGRTYRVGPLFRLGLVPEVAAVREDHRRVGLGDCGDHLVVSLRAAGLNQRLDSRGEREPRPVREGKERIRCERGAVQIVIVLACLVERDPDGVDTAHLAGADPERL